MHDESQFFPSVQHNSAAAGEIWSLEGQRTDCLRITLSDMLRYVPTEFFIVVICTMVNYLGHPQPFTRAHMESVCIR